MTSEQVIALLTFLPGSVLVDRVIRPLSVAATRSAVIGLGGKGRTRWGSGYFRPTGSAHWAGRQGSRTTAGWPNGGASLRAVDGCCGPPGAALAMAVRAPGRMGP